MSAMSGPLESNASLYLQYIPYGTTEVLETCMALATAYQWQSSEDEHSEITTQLALTAFASQSTVQKLCEQTESQTKEIINTVKTAQTNATAPIPQQSYAQTLTKNAPVQGPSHHLQPPKDISTSNPLRAHHPSRLIILIKPCLPANNRPTDHKLVKDINEVLSLHTDPSILMVVSVKWNKEGNCILLTCVDQKAADLAKYLPKFEHLINPNNTMHKISAHSDEKWLNFEIGGSAPEPSTDR